MHDVSTDDDLAAALVEMVRTTKARRR